MAAARGRAAASETGLGLAGAPHFISPLHGRSCRGCRSRPGCGEMAVGVWSPSCPHPHPIPVSSHPNPVPICVPISIQSLSHPILSLFQFHPIPIPSHPVPVPVPSLSLLTWLPSLSQVALQSLHHGLRLGELQLAGGPLPDAAPQLHGWGGHGGASGVPGRHTPHPPPSRRAPPAPALTAAVLLHQRHLEAVPARRAGVDVHGEVGRGPAQCLAHRRRRASEHPSALAGGIPGGVSTRYAPGAPPPTPLTPHPGQLTSAR